MELRKRVEDYNKWCSENKIDAHIDLNFVDEYIKKCSMNKFTALLNGNQHITGIVVELKNQDHDLCLLYNTSQHLDWGYKNTPVELKQLGITNTHGYTHHWLYPNGNVTELNLNPSKIN